MTGEMECFQNALKEQNGHKDAVYLLQRDFREQLLPGSGWAGGVPGLVARPVPSHKPRHAVTSSGRLPPEPRESDPGQAFPQSLDKQPQVCLHLLRTLHTHLYA